MLEEIKQDARKRMDKSIDSLKQSLQKIRTGRANTSLLDHLTVEYYGNPTPLNQVANVTVEDARTLVVTPWEKSIVQDVEKAIMKSDLGLNPATAGTVIRIPLPPMTEERRKEMIKVVKSEGENSKIAIRNIRRDALSDSKDLLKEKEISEDDDRRMQDQIQKITDEFVAKVESVLSVKEKELMDF